MKEFEITLYNKRTSKIIDMFTVKAKDWEDLKIIMKEKYDAPNSRIAFYKDLV